MIFDFFSQIKTALILTLIFTLITGLVYPGVMTGISQLLFHHKANGSLIIQDDKIKGSTLIGQDFKNPKYFWGRPSATTPQPYNAAKSNASNLGPSNPERIKNVKVKVELLKSFPHPLNQAIPVDLVTSSASGLDPEISIEAALYQIPRIAKSRGLKESDLIDLIQKQIIKPTLGFLGPNRLNVLDLNLALEAHHD